MPRSQKLGTEVEERVSGLGNSRTRPLPTAYPMKPHYKNDTTKTSPTKCATRLSPVHSTYPHHPPLYPLHVSTYIRSIGSDAPTAGRRTLTYDQNHPIYDRLYGTYHNLSILANISLKSLCSSLYKSIHTMLQLLYRTEGYQ